MKALQPLTLAFAVLSALTCANASEPRVGETVVLGAFTGPGATLHPNNAAPNRIRYYGTDLGWSYVHEGKIEFLFGDSWGSDKGEPTDPPHDDIYGSIDVAAWPDPAKIATGNLPIIEIGQLPGSAQAGGLDPGVPLESLKTPVAGFSNGAREFAIFVTGKPVACNTHADCGGGLSCDTGVGFRFARPDLPAGLTLACRDGEPGCNADTKFGADGAVIKDSGLCSDRSSTLWADTDWGRVAAVADVQLIGLRNTTDPSRYTDVQQWTTNKFINVAARVDLAGKNRRLLMWGRPWFVGVNAKGRTLGLYFAYVDLPAGPGFSWNVHYYAGSAVDGGPRYSESESDAIPLDLDATQAGVQPAEPHDLVQQMSVVRIGQLKKWVMFYGGGVSSNPIPLLAPNCGVLEIFARAECADVQFDDGAMYMRSADNPWGPWSPPQNLIIGGDPGARPVANQYAAGGALHHPACDGKGCIAKSPSLPQGDYGFFYGANIIEPWIRSAGKGVDVIWNASTWDPYGVILLRTRINAGGK